MPYATNRDLPPALRDNLPSHAQDIFREAFNHALQQYGRDETAFRVAWAAVRRKYERLPDGEWVDRHAS